MVLCRYSSAAPTVHHVVPCTTGLLGTHGFAMTAPTTAIQTAIVGMRNGEYWWQYISMNTGPSGRPLRPIPTRHISCQKDLESGVRRDCRLILVLQG